MSAYWPFWIGAPALALVTVGACLVGRRPLGVSGIVARFVDLRREIHAERGRAAVAAADDAVIEAALLAATLEAFGPMPIPAGLAPDAATLPAPAQDASGARSVTAAGGACGDGCHAADSRPTLGAHAVFLLAIVAGGFLAQLARGGWSPTLGFGEAFGRIVGSGPAGWAALLGGGLLVGAGTAISGGCSTGHGLSGCSRLQPAGLAATATFFAVAVAVSFLLAGSLG